jgi:hypothetical protein
MTVRTEVTPAEARYLMPGRDLHGRAAPRVHPMGRHPGGKNSCATMKAYLDAVPPGIEKYTGVLAAADVYTAHTALWFWSRSASTAVSGSTFAPEDDRGRR